MNFSTITTKAHKNPKNFIPCSKYNFNFSLLRSDNHKNNYYMNFLYIATKYQPTTYSKLTVTAKICLVTTRLHNKRT